MNRKNIRIISPRECSVAKKYRISTNELQPSLVRADHECNSNALNKEVIVILSDSEDESDEPPQTVQQKQQQLGIVQPQIVVYREEDEDEEEEMLLRAIKNNLQNEKLKEQQKQPSKEVIEILSDSEDENETLTDGTSTQPQLAPVINCAVVKAVPQGLEVYYQENNITYPTNHHFHNITYDTIASYNNNNNNNNNNTQNNIETQLFQLNNSSRIPNRINHEIYNICDNNNNVPVNKNSNDIICNAFNNINNSIRSNRNIVNNIFNFNDMRQALQAIEDDLYYMEVDLYPSYFSQKRKRNHDAEDGQEKKLQIDFFSKRRKLDGFSWKRISSTENATQDTEMVDVMTNIKENGNKTNANKKKYRSSTRHKSRSRRQLF